MPYNFDPTILIRLLFDIPIIGDLWWLWSFLILYFIARSLWLVYAQECFKKSIKWVFLELRIPREQQKSPRSMEQVFMAMHSLRNSPGNWKEKWWDGEVPQWFCCEIASFGGEVHFYLRVPERHRNTVEAVLYANYPDLEIAETEDYVNRLYPSAGDLFKAGLNLFGSELILAKPDAYPIRTYMEFEEIEEERQLDPISTLIEILAKINPRETIWVQILAQPVPDDSWKEESKKLIEKFKEETGRTMIETSTGKITWSERSPGETDVLKALDRNIAKPGFETMIRYIYIAPESSYDSNFGQRAVPSAFNQYASESLNKFKHNNAVWTRASMWYFPYLFPKRRTRARKERIYANYKERRLREANLFSSFLDLKFFHWGLGGKNRVVLNTEELATIFHLPTAIVLTGPMIKRVEARKVGPPAGLAIFGEGEEGLPGV